MPSIVKDKRRGTYLVQWFDGKAWRRATVHRMPGWKPGKSAFPARDPLAVTQALAEYSEREREARRGRGPADPGRTVADFLAAYRDAYARERAAGSAVQLGHAVKNFLAWCQEAKVARLADVTPAACQRFLDWRARQSSKKTGGSISPARLSQERAMLSGAWRRAVRLREVPENPWTPTEAPGWARARKSRPRKPSWSPEEFSRLVAVCRPWLRDLLTIGVNVGVRISALLALEWRDVHWAGSDEQGFGDVEVRPEWDKAGKGYRVPISRACHDVLARRLIHRDAHATHVITGDRGAPTRVSTSATGIIRACKRAGLPEPKSPNHHMRRTFGRWAVLGHLTGRPVPIYIVSRWMGHSTVKMTEEYLQLDPDTSREWMAEFTPRKDDPPPPATPPPASGDAPHSV